MKLSKFQKILTDSTIKSLKEQSIPQKRATKRALLINASNVKKHALAYSKQHRAGKFTRVSKEFIERCNRQLAAFIDAEVQRHPSKGMTIQ